MSAHGQASTRETPPGQGRGGERPRVHTALTHDVIDVGTLLAAAQSPSCGALASFTGTVRDHSQGGRVLRLDYEAYEPMARDALPAIAGALADQHSLEAISIVHRLGSLQVGEVSVVVIAAAAHRAPALAACAAAIERIKREVPIWKREHHPGRAEWVDARCAEEPDNHGDGHRQAHAR